MYWTSEKFKGIVIWKCMVTMTCNLWKALQVYLFIWLLLTPLCEANCEGNIIFTQENTVWVAKLLATARLGLSVTWVTSPRHQTALIKPWESYVHTASIALQVYY